MRQKYFLSFYLDKVALLRKEKGKIHVELLKTMAENVKPLYMLRPVLYGKNVELVTGLDPQDVVLRNLLLKLKSRREILATLPFQVENLLPYKSEELLLLPTLFPQKQGTNIFILASSKNSLSQHLKKNADKEVDPDIVSCIPSALFRFATHYFPKYPSLFIHHPCVEKGVFVVVQNGHLHAAQAHREEDFERTWAFMQKKYPAIQDVLFFGKPPPESTFNELRIEDSDLFNYAIPIGLALDPAIGDSQSAQFRRQDNPSQKHREKKKRQLLRYFGICAGFVIVTLVMGHLHIKSREKALLEAIGASEYAHLTNAVEELENSLYQQKKSSIAISPLPKVHEVLTWLSTHPKLTEDCSITHFRYQIIKAPRLGSKVKTYSAKVDVEMTTENTRAARSFHEALRKDTVIVDQKHEVHWNADHGIYRASFFLKPKNKGE